jgi:hypothetical protein
VRGALPSEGFGLETLSECVGESMNAMLTFRDPDNIQLEVFFDGAWQASESRI